MRISPVNSSALNTKRSRSCSSAGAPSHHLGSSLRHTSRGYDFHFIKFRPTDIHVWLTASRERLLRAPRPLHLRLRCHNGKRCRSAADCSAALHNRQLTDPSIRSRRARLLTSAAARLSPQTCFRLPHCLGNRHACCLASQPPAFGHPLSGGPCCLRQRQPAAMPTRPAMSAAVTSSPSPWPPFPWLADYRCQSADADLPPVRLPNPCRLRRHPLSGEFPASRPVAPVIVPPLILLVVMSVVAESCPCTTSASVLLL